MFSLNMVGLIAVVAISLSLSLMFPTIYGVALQGLGEDAKFGAAGLVMAILGGALLPLVQGKVMDEVGTAIGFVVPGGVPGAGRVSTRCSTSAPSRDGGALVSEGGYMTSVTTPRRARRRRRCSRRRRGCRAAARAAGSRSPSA